MDLLLMWCTPQFFPSCAIQLCPRQQHIPLAAMHVQCVCKPYFSNYQRCSKECAINKAAAPDCAHWLTSFGSFLPNKTLKFSCFSSSLRSAHVKACWLASQEIGGIKDLVPDLGIIAD